MSSTQILAVLVSALLVQLDVMEGNEAAAEWLGWGLVILVGGLVMATLATIVYKWRASPNIDSSEV